MSQQDGKTKKIGEHNYTVHMIDPLDAVDITVELSNAVAPSVESLASVVKKTGIDKILDEKVENSAAIGAAIGAFLKQLERSKVRELISILAPVTVVEGKGKLDQIFSEHFRGKPGAIYQWLGFAMQVNFADFFDWLRGAIAGAGLLGGDPSSSQNT
jgi:hypothetical protein